MIYGACGRGSSFCGMRSRPPPCSPFNRAPLLLTQAFYPHTGQHSPRLRQQLSEGASQRSALPPAAQGWRLGLLKARFIRR
jgi:hypothetical protein